jgi:hypothetical protein
MLAEGYLLPLSSERMSSRYCHLWFRQTVLPQSSIQVEQVLVSLLRRCVALWRSVIARHYVPSLRHGYVRFAVYHFQA